LIGGFSCFSQGYLDTFRVKLKKAVNDSARIEVLYSFSFNKKLPSRTTDSLKEQIKQYVNSPSCRVKWLAELRLAMYEDFKGYDKVALSHYLDVFNLAEKCKDTLGMSLATSRLGMINVEMQNYKLAIKFLHEAIVLSAKAKDEDQLAENYLVLGTSFRESKFNDSSLHYTMKALELREKQGNKKKIANVLNNIGLTYKMSKQYEKGVEFLKRALSIRREVKDQRGIAGACINIANCLKSLGKCEEGIVYAIEGTRIAHDSKEGEFFRNGVWALADLYRKKGDYKMASTFYVRHKEVNDSIRMGVIDKNMQEMMERFESNKKDMELKTKEHDLEMVEAANSKKNVLIIFSAIALLMTIVAIAFIYRSYLINKKSAKDLFQKNKLIEEKNKEITDSINYAKNIQSSLLASDEVFSKNVKEHFIFFRPKDIVSGDFYWAQNTEEGFLVMCADCTGHGVPGAFMSLLGISHLKEICGKLKDLNPDRILNELRKQFIENFSLSNSKDGMDASLIKIKGMQLQMAAANNPIWIIRDNSCIHMKPNKFPIGKHHGEIQEFSLNTFELKSNDLLILFTDGFADQFGGPKNKKYKYKQLEEFILKNSQAPLSTMNPMLEDELITWKGKNEQIDDVLVIGIRI